MRKKIKNKFITTASAIALVATPTIVPMLPTYALELGDEKLETRARPSRPMADQYSPEASPEEILVGESYYLLDNVDLSALPEGTELLDASEEGAIDINTPGEYSGFIEVSYPDGSYETVPVTVTVIDEEGEGEEGEDSTDVMPSDETPPVITGEARIVEPDGAPFDYMLGISANDDTDGDITDQVTYTGTVDTTKVGSYPVVYSVADAAGNKASLTITHLVRENEPPVITELKPFKFAPSESKPEFNLAEYLKATDNYDGDLTDAIEADYTQVKWDTVGTYPASFIVTDSSGNSFTHNTYVVIEEEKEPDLEAPKLTGSPQIIEYGTVDTFDYMKGVQAMDNVDGDITDKVTYNGNVDLTKLGKYPVTYEVTDAAGNKSTLILNHVVQDTEAPVITSIRDFIFKQSETPPSIVLGHFLTATDNYDGNITKDIQSDFSKVQWNVPGSYPAEFVVEDSSGNSFTYKTNVLITAPEDTEAPELTGTPQVVKIGETFDYMKGIKAIDNVDGDITANVTYTGTVDTSKEGVYPVTYEVTDKAGNKATLVLNHRVVPGEDEDTEAPKLTGTAQTIYVGDSFDYMAGVKAIDDVDGDITDKVTYTGEVDVNKPGVYPVVYSVKDSAGNEATMTLNHTVLEKEEPENTPPTITGPTEITVKVGDVINPDALGVTATDAEDGNLVPVCLNPEVVDTSKPGQFVLLYEAEDSAGLKSEIHRLTVKVEAEEPIPVEKVVLSFETNGGNPIAPMEFDKGSVPGSVPDAVRDGFIFKGWFKEAGLQNAFDPSLPLNEDLTIYAKWEKVEPVIEYVNISFHPQNGDGKTVVQIEKGTSIPVSDMPAIPTHDGFTFKGWFDGNGNAFNISMVFNANADFYASWEEVVTPTPDPEPEPEPEPEISYLLYATSRKGELGSVFRLFNGDNSLFQIMKSVDGVSSRMSHVDMNDEGGYNVRFVQGPGNIHTDGDKITFDEPCLSQADHHLYHVALDFKGKTVIAKVFVYAEDDDAEIITISASKTASATAGSKFDPMKHVNTDPSEAIKDVTWEIRDGQTDEKLDASIVNEIPAGKYIITYFYKGNAKTSLTLTVTPPVVNVEGGKPFLSIQGDNLVTYVGQKLDLREFAIANDSEGNDLKDKIEITENVDWNKPGKYEVTYSVTDSKGLSTSKTVTVTVLTKAEYDVVVSKDTAAGEKVQTFDGSAANAASGVLGQAISLGLATVTGAGLAVDKFKKKRK